MSSSKHGFVAMIQDKWWQELLRKNHERTGILSYVRVGTAAPNDTSMLFFYVTKPVGELAGYAEFIERKVGETKEMWTTYGHESALDSKQQYEQFVNGKRKVSFIRFRNLHEASRPVPLRSLRMLLVKKRLPRAGFYISKEANDELLLLME